MEYRKIGDNYYIRMDRGDVFSFKKDGQHGMAGGHLKGTTVLYNAEMRLARDFGHLRISHYDDGTFP